MVLSEQTLTSLEQADRESHEAITGNFIRWEAIDVFYRDQVLRSGGHTFSGVARKMGGQGCDLIHVVGGQTTPDFKPEEGRGSLLDLCERGRNEARLPTLTGAYLTAPDSVNTVLAAGRADLCVLDGWRK